MRSNLNTLNKIQNKIKSIHGNSIKLVEPYKPGKVKNTFICKCKNKWDAHYYNVVNSTHPTGCPKCSTHKNNRYTSNEFKTLLKEKQPSLKMLSEYKTAKEKILVQCENGHSWFCIPRMLLKSKLNGCPECVKKYRADYHKDPKGYKKKLLIKHSKIKWIGNNTEYKNNQSKLTFKCKNNHTFKDVAQRVIFRHFACPHCSKPSSSKNWHQGSLSNYSKVSIECINKISKSTRLVFVTAENSTEYRLPSTRYKIDGFNYRYKIAIEFHGSYFHGEHDKRTKLYINTIKRDAIIKLHPDVKLFIAIWESEWRSNPIAVINRITLKIKKFKALQQ